MVGVAALDLGSPDIERMEGLLRILCQGVRTRSAANPRAHTLRTEGSVHVRPPNGFDNREAIREIVKGGLVRNAPDGPTLNREELSALIQDLRLLVEIEDEPESDPRATQVTPPNLAGAWQNGPKLILCKGFSEGAIFPLQGSRPSWVIGRGTDVDVRLPFDPYVSRHSAEVWKDHCDYFLEDLAPAKNGTYLNWRRLDRREVANLRDGDIVCVGRSLMVFRTT